MRLLHAWHADDARSFPSGHANSDRGRREGRNLRKHLPMHRLSRHRASGARYSRSKGEPDMSGRFFGAAVTRVEDARLLTGTGHYVDDIELPGMLHAAFVRASFAHGRIRSIDKRDALKM